MDRLLDVLAGVFLAAAVTFFPAMIILIVVTFR